MAPESPLPMQLKSQHGLMTLRKAVASDGKHMWQCAKDTQILDPNSGYMYNLYCRQFADSCLVAVNDKDEMVGYVVAHHLPKKTDTLFVWQIGVHPDYQHGGIGIAMLSALVEDVEASFLQASVTPSNAKGNNLFQKYAKSHQSEFTRTKDWMGDADFSEAEPKPAEHLYDIGPIHGKHRDATGSFPIGPSKDLLAGIELLDNDHELGPFRSYYGKHNKDSEHVHLQNNPDLVKLITKESNARSYVRKFPFIVQKAEGCTLTDVDGNRFLDFLGCAGTLALGHNHPVQINAMMRVMKAKYPLQVLDMATTPKAEFMSELFQFLPSGMSEDFRVQFCGGSGSDAVDAAVKVCKTATGRGTVLCFHGAYHGHGQGPLAMMGNLGSKGPVQGLMPGVGFLPFPNNYRQPFGLATGEGGEGDKAVLKYIEHLLKDDESGVTKPACVVLEVVQGEGGLNAMSNWALRELRRITAENDIPLICDEIQSGFCRSGQKFAFEHSGIIPDVVCLSKAIGGSQPMACIVYNKKLDTWGPGAHTGTFRGNGLAFAAGAATLRHMRENKMWEVAEAKGQLIKSLLSGKSKYIGDIRGFGLMLGIEFVDPAKVEKDGKDMRSSSGGALCGQVQVECLKRGLIIEKGGRGGAVLRPLPPLIVTEAEIRQACAIILEAVTAAALKVGLR